MVNKVLAIEVVWRMYAEKTNEKDTAGAGRRSTPQVSRRRQRCCDVFRFGGLCAGNP